MFMTITAISLFYVYSEHFDVKTFYKKRMLYVVLPYVIWSIFYLIWDRHGVALTEFIWMIFTGKAHYHLWYMGMVLRVYLFFPMTLTIVRWIRSRGRKFNVYFLLLFTIGNWFILKHNDVVTTQLAKAIFGQPTVYQQRLIEISPVLWSIYFVLGIIMSYNYTEFFEGLHRYKKYLVLSYLVLLSYNYYDEIMPHLTKTLSINFAPVHQVLYMAYMLNAICIFFLVAQRLVHRSWIYEKLRSIADYSYAEYLIHVYIIGKVAEFFWVHIPMESFLWSGLCIFFVTLIVTVKSCEFLSALPFAQYLLGTNKRYKSFLYTFWQWFSQRGSISNGL